MTRAVIPCTAASRGVRKSGAAFDKLPDGGSVPVGQDSVVLACSPRLIPGGAPFERLMARVLFCQFTGIAEGKTCPPQEVVFS